MLSWYTVHEVSAMVNRLGTTGSVGYAKLAAAQKALHRSHSAHGDDAVHLSSAARECLSHDRAHRTSHGHGASPSPVRLQRAIRDSLTPELLRGPYKKQWTPSRPRSWGHCYVASEAYYHLMGGKASGLKPCWVKHEGSTHHFLRDEKTGKVVDLTGDQFKKTPPYERGTPFGWLTGDTPSHRAQILMDAAVARLKGRP